MMGRITSSIDTGIRAGVSMGADGGFVTARRRSLSSRVLGTSDGRTWATYGQSIGKRERRCTNLLVQPERPSYIRRLRRGISVRRCGDTAGRRGCPTPLSVRGRAEREYIRILAISYIPHFSVGCKGTKSRQRPTPVDLAPWSLSRFVDTAE